MLDSTISFRLVNTSELHLVLQARTRTYLADLGRDVDDGNDPLGHHVIAIRATGEVLGGVRLLGPELRPFDFESTLDLSPAVRLGERPALLGRLFLSPEFRPVARSTPLLVGLLREVLSLGSRLRLTHLYIYSFEHLLTFYRRAGFESLGITIYHERWRTLHLMRLVLAPSPRTGL